MKHFVLTFLGLWISNILSAQKNFDIITNFSQGFVEVSDSFQECNKDHELGNCAAIALIKCALIAFESKENIFNMYETKDDVISCTFHDEVQASVFAYEVDSVKKLSGIKGDPNNQDYNDAMIIYALICKRVLEHKNDICCIKNFVNAVEYVNSGYATADVHELLGLKKVPIDLDKLKDYKACIIWSNAHAAYCSFGQQDILGEKYKVRFRFMKNPIGIGGRIQGGYGLTK